MTPPAVGPQLSLREVSRSIGASQILRNVSLELLQGEIHALVGVNGAGKSSLIRILSGADSGYSGEVWQAGERLRLRSPRDAQRAGIHVIYQELSLVGSLSVTDNWLLANRGNTFGWLSRREVRLAARAHCRRLGLELDPDRPVEHFSLNERQLIEIARALSQRARVLILDEPTSALSETEAARLLDELGRLREAGTTMLYVSHRMEEIYRIANRVSVLRDGCCVLTRTSTQLPPRDLLQAMLGGGAEGVAANVAASTLPLRASLAPAGLLRVVELGCAGGAALSGVNFSVQSGEILGIAALRGAGGSELLEVLGGARQPNGGRIEWRGALREFASPAAAFAGGFALLPADRAHSVFRSLDAIWNGTLSALDRYARGGFIRRAVSRRDVAAWASAVSLSCTSLEDEAGRLSGGNQQKLALVRCLMAQPQVLLLDEPTRGVDVAAKRQIQDLVLELASQGLAVVVQSSELEELLRLCTRVVVLYRGRQVVSFERAELSRERLLAAMMGSAA